MEDEMTQLPSHLRMRTGPNLGVLLYPRKWWICSKLENNTWRHYRYK